MGDSTTTSLAYLRKGHLEGNHGMRGQIRSMDGRNGKDIVISLPLGTSVYEIVREGKVNKKELRRDLPYKTRLLCEIDIDKKLYKIVQGGSGGYGNSKAGVLKNKSLSYQEITANRIGKKGQDLELELELRCVSDVCLIGFPNAGKSTLMASVISKLTILDDESNAKDCCLRIYNNASSSWKNTI